MESFEELVRKRGVIKSTLTRFTNFIKNNPQDIAGIRLRLVNVNTTLQQFNDVQWEIESKSPIDALKGCEEERDSFENRYYAAVRDAEEIINAWAATNETNVCNANSSSDRSSQRSSSEAGGSQVGTFHDQNIAQGGNVHLPKISLPTFDGKQIAEWQCFQETFDSMINSKVGLADIQKFHYLKSCIKGAAGEVIESLEVTGANYTVAWELLKERYSNKKLAVLGHIRAIFELPTNMRESPSGLRAISDGTLKHLRALKTLEQPTDHWGTLIAYVIMSKLDGVTKRELEKIHPTEIPTVEELSKFIKEKAQILENLQANSLSNNSSQKPKSSASFVATYEYKCYHCDNKHALYHCESFQKLKIGERYSRLRELGLCANCLRKGHKASNCRSRGCGKCKGRHNSLLHDAEREKKVECEQPAAEEVELPNATTTVMCTTFSGLSQVLLSTAIVEVLDKDGKAHTARALLDSGSQSHFITQKLLEELKLPNTRIEFTVTGLNQVGTDVKRQANIKIKATHGFYETNMSCLVVPNIGGHIPAIPVDEEKLKIPNRIRLADKTFGKVGKIDLLIGAEKFWPLVKSRQLSLGRNKPILQDTELGWVVAGQVPIKTQKASTVYCGLINDQLISEQLAKFWEIESCPNHEIRSPEEAACEISFNTTTTRLNNGRFVVKYPLKDSIDKLGESKQMALKRLIHTEKRLERNPNLKNEYAKFLKEYEDLGHLTKIKEPQDAGAYYLPHQCVVRQESLTTKIRVVFDASAKTTSGVSLNDIQITGPTLQQDLFSIIVRFRKHNVVLTADVTKMYRQILIHEEQRPLQRILWRDETSGEINCYQLNTVTYGTAAASFLAVRCMIQLAKECKLSNPSASAIITNDFYMDDLLTGGETTEEVIKINQEVTKILGNGCLQLNKWSSNDSKVLEAIKNHLPDVILNIGEQGETKTLGLSWYATRDELKYKMNFKEANGVLTKRMLLSAVAQIFDPLGLLGPIVIVSKLMLQRLWQYELQWDDPVPAEMSERFDKFRRQLPIINEIKIERRVVCQGPNRIELHGFSDASEAAYGAAIYLRSTNQDGEISSKLLCAKSRVAPLKTLSVPRLELCAAYLLSQLYVKVEKALNMNIDQAYLWCDSQIVLAWIASSPHLLKIFCANRVSEIQTITKAEDWRYVNTSENPADLLTRGVDPKDLAGIKKWWHGPPWLQESASQWPHFSQRNGETESAEFQKEIKKVQVSMVTIQQETNAVFERFSTYRKLQRVQAYCLRFKNNMRTPKAVRQIGVLTPNELEDAAISLLRASQRDSFGDELKNLKKDNPLKKGSRLIALDPFVDNDSVIRVGGRLRRSDYNYGKKHPALLDSKHRLSVLLIKFEHERLLHAGPQTVLASLRERVWIISARNVVRKVVRNCVTCFRLKPVPLEYIMADLPKARVTPSRPFSNCGIDFAGPFLIKNKNGRKYNVTKGYVCLFVCLASKAIHLELVSELTTDAFRAALHRFVSRRGNCINVYTDNGTNFVGAKREIYKLQDAIKGQSPFERVTWHFIPPRAPHFGGIWEAGVRSFKHHFYRVVKDTKLTFEEFYTVLTQCEACLNSRPLHPLSTDPNDPNPLTPGHFLIGEAITGMVEARLEEVKISPLRRFKLIQQLQQWFWARWSTDYVAELQTRCKWKQRHSTLLGVGSLVIVKEDGLAPLKWELGRVRELYPGSDGVIRSVLIKTKNGEITRPTVKVCVLPVTDH